MASVGLSTATEEDEPEQDDDLEFSSYVTPQPSSSRKGATNTRFPRGEDTAAAKRRRTLANPFLGEMQAHMPELEDRDDTEISAPTPFIEAPTRTSKAEEKIAKVIKLFNDKKAAFSDEILFEGKVKSRAFSALQKALEQGANQIVSEPDYAHIAKEMVEFPESVTAKWNLFQRFKKEKLTDVLVNLQGNELELMASLRSSMVSKVILSVAGGLLKDIEDMLGSWGPGVIGCIIIEQ